MRSTEPGDAAVVAQIVAEAFDGYRAIAPPGWEPPAHDLDAELIRSQLGRADVWSVLAEAGGGAAGCISIMSAAAHGSRPSPDTGLAHLWQLFVRPAWWGSGLAEDLHGRAMEAAAAHGYRAMRLFTPAAQARARRFYEREGWTTVGAPSEEMGFGMPLVEYRRPISISV